MRFFEKDLRIKITASFIILVLIGSIAALVISYMLVESIVRNNIEASMLDSARVTTNLLGVALERRETRMRLLSDYPVLRDRNASVQDKRAALDLFISTWPIGSGAVLLDTNGNVITGTGGLSSVGNVSDTSWFQNAETAHIAFTYVDSPQELTALGYSTPVLAVSAPIRDDKDQIYAYAVAFTTLADVRDAIVGVRIGHTGYAFLLDGAGAEVAGSIIGPNIKPTRREAQELARAKAEITSGRSGRTDLGYRGQQYLLTYTPVVQARGEHPEIDWSVGVAVPEGEAYAPARKVAWALLALAGFLLIAAVLVSIPLGRSIIRPIDELAATAEKMGSGDLTGEVAIRTRDQIGTLAAALLRMRDHLRGVLGKARYSSEAMSALAEEQSAATHDVFSNIEEIVDSVVALSRNMETQTQKIQKILEHCSALPPESMGAPSVAEIKKLVEESEILAEVGASKAVDIASATQDQRAAVRDVAASARRLSEMAAELKGMVSQFKV